jgi:aminoglycoside phosphotransferase (APT) family kinase protein
MNGPSDAIGAAPDPEILAFIDSTGLLEGTGEPRYTPLTGGVSSDIWLVDTGPRRFCVKRALAKLRVAADWRAPVERSVLEAAWLKGAARVAPDAVPMVLADDTDAGMLAMEYLPLEDFKLWKAELMAGRADSRIATAVGERLTSIHAAFARDAEAPATFPRDDIFHSIRLEPYLEATGRAHPDLAERLAYLARRTGETKRSVVHGDVSPKNILIGPKGPVFLDAECAWFGDPAFDVAFCLNHLLLKCLVRPSVVASYLASFDALRAAYFAGVDWEDARALEERIATLLPGLFLARVDGKSPVEYLTEERDRQAVRRVARALLRDPCDSLKAVRDAWAADLENERPGR